MTTHKRVGFFFEQSVEDQQRSLNSLRSDVAHPKEDQIVEYLVSGINVCVYMMHEHDYLADPPVFIGEGLVKSDGEWVWPASLAHYVREYHISLPQEFIEKMERTDWRVPPNAECAPDIPEGHVEM
ncbi:MAG: hypothetical protein KDA90_06945 [Planctomycetaceae bacterium]|nr:hypothetical protein [Planctomycetaceae bacterium]